MTVLGALRQYSTESDEAKLTQRQQTFLRVKDDYRRQLLNFANEAPYQHTLYVDDDDDDWGLMIVACATCDDTCLVIDIECSSFL